MYIYMYKRVEGIDAWITKSNRKNKKLRVFFNKDYPTVIHFGDNRYEHYHDKTGIHSDLDHNDKKRRALYRKRAKGQIRNGKPSYLDPYSATFWSYNLLW